VAFTCTIWCAGGQRSAGARETLRTGAVVSTTVNGAAASPVRPEESVTLRVKA
jgi:hypothetical protein